MQKKVIFMRKAGIELRLIVGPNGIGVYSDSKERMEKEMKRKWYFI